MEEQNLHSQLFGEDAEPSAPIYPVIKLERSADNLVIAGVCGGIANYTGKDASTIRILAMMMLLLGVWIVAAYLIIAFLLSPGKHNENLIEKNISATEKENFKTVLSGLFILAGLYFSLTELRMLRPSGIFFLPNGFMIPLISVAAGVFLLTNKISPKKQSQREEINFYREREDKFLLGVCGGLAKYIGVDSSTLRIIFLLLTGLTLGMFALVYLIISFSSKHKPFPHPTNE